MTAHCPVARNDVVLVDEAMVARVCEYLKTHSVMQTMADWKVGQQTLQQFRDRGRVKRATYEKVKAALEKAEGSDVPT